MADPVRIFVSHSHEDNAWCREFVNTLRRAGADVWYDEHNLGFGALRAEIERELVDRPIFIVVLSPAAIKSRWVNDEMDVALDLQHAHPERVIIPVIAVQCEVPLFWRKFKRQSGPGDTALSAAEAAGRVAHALALSPGAIKEAPLRAAVTELMYPAFTRGHELIAQERYSEALDIFNQVLTSNPKESDAWYYKAQCLEKLQRYAEAVDTYDMILALNPSRSGIWSRKGDTLSTLHRYQDAVVAYNRALELNPATDLVWANKGSALSALGQYEEALGAFERAIAIDATKGTYWTSKGLALHRVKRYDEELAAFDHALELDPNMALHWSNRASALFFLT